MNFKFYDIMASAIHGAILIGTVLFVFDINIKEVWAIYLLVASFYIGYLINAIGGWLEGIYYRIIAGKPSKELFHNNKNKDYSGFGRIHFYFVDETIAFLKDDCNTEKLYEDKFFSKAYGVAKGVKDTRINDYVASYAFARTMLTTVLLGSVTVLIKYYNLWYVDVIVLLTIIACFVRYAERGYYFAKEVLYVYYNSKIK